MSEQFNWDDGPLQLVYRDKIYPNITFADRGNGLNNIFGEDGDLITDVHQHNGNAYFELPAGAPGRDHGRHFNTYVEKMPIKENMMYGIIKPQPVLAMSDEELAKELRAIDGRYYELFKELENRGYTMTDVDGDELATYALDRIYKNTVTEL